MAFKGIKMWWVYDRSAEMNQHDMINEDGVGYPMTVVLIL